jgi:hypothetical protein
MLNVNIFYDPFSISVVKIAYKLENPAVLLGDRDI